MGHVRVLMDRSGRLVVPKDLRTSLGVENGGELLLSIKDGALLAMTHREAVRRVQSMFESWQPGQPLASEELIAERRREALRDLE